MTLPEPPKFFVRSRPDPTQVTYFHLHVLNLRQFAKTRHTAKGYRHE